MKAFKKWWDKLLCSNNENFRVIAESTWRAALEEVLKQIDQSAEQPYLTLQNLMDWIEKELNE